MITIIPIIIAVFMLIYFYISSQGMVDKIPKPVTIMVTEEKI
jgi:heme/copper-type cytochrome/quinol oxidase subunit 2